MSEILRTRAASPRSVPLGDRIVRVRTILGDALLRVALRVRAGIDAARSRWRLQMLNDRELRDLGLDRDRAARDSTSSFWRLR